MTRASQVLARAKGYPYETASGSFVLMGGAVEALGPRDLARARLRALAEPGVLAYGSNAAPSAIRAKAAAPSFPATPAIPFLRASMQDLDVVYSAHLSPYGAVPATLRSSPGTVAPGFVMLPSHEQLAALRATEPNYDLVELPAGAVVLEGGGAPAVRAFASRHGCLRVGGSAVALRAVQSAGRCLPALREEEVLRLVAGRLGAGADLDAFILETAGDPGRAGSATRELRRDAIAMDLPSAL